MAEIGFIGLGNMGLPMAINLVKAGHKVTGFDRVSSACDQARAEGVTIASTAAEAATDRDFVVTMLPNGAISLSVLNEIAPVARKGTIIIDSSTIDVASAKKAHEIAAAAGLGFLDAPVSGGVGGAAAGTLTFMIGGKADDFEKAKPVIDVMAGRMVHCGDGGAGQSAKICNNMLLGISMIGACEAFAMAEKLGLSQQSLFDVVSTSSGSCWSVNAYCPVPGIGPKSPADNEYRPGFAAALMLKDLGLSQEAAASSGAATPKGARATEIYKSFVEAGGADTDFSGIIKFLDQVK